LIIQILISLLSQELSTNAFEVFDRYGRSKPEFKNQVIRRGTGCWGSELDLGSLFILEHMLAEKPWRQKGVGRLMTNSLLSKSRSGEKQPAFTLVVPGWLNSDIIKG
jgi:hypothetical protein